jgi:hypothetical protein
MNNTNFFPSSNNNNIFSNQLFLPISNDKILNDLTKELNTSTVILKQEIGRIFKAYEENNKKIIKKYCDIYNNNKKMNKIY